MAIDYVKDFTGNGDSAAWSKWRIWSFELDLIDLESMLKFVFSIIFTGTIVLMWCHDEEMSYFDY